MSAEQLVGQVASYEAASASNSYALGLCLRELSQSGRYRDELGFDTFDALLVARKLPSRMTAFKLVQVVSTFSEAEVTKLGGPAKGYAFIRLAKRQGRSTDPRRFLAPNAKVAGLAVSVLSLRDIERIPDGMKISMTERDKAAKKISSQLGAELGRVGVAHRMRVHGQPEPVVDVRLDPGSAKQLLELLKRYRKLEKQGKSSRKGAFT